MQDSKSPLIHLLLLCFMQPLYSHAETAVVYEKDIAPILRSYCAGCHNDKDQEAKLSVETYARLRQGGEDEGDPIKAAELSASVFLNVTHNAGKAHMPPKDEPQVPAKELATLKQWVLGGAPGPAHDVSILRSLTVPSISAAACAKPFTAVAYSADGKLLALARTGTVEIQDASTEAVRQTITGLPGKVSAVHFTVDHQQIIIATGITGLYGVAQLRDVASGALVREFSGHADVLSDAEISPDGKMLATAGYDREIKLWDLPQGTLLRTISVHKGAIFDLAWHPNSKVLASASADETIKLWRVADGVRLDTLNQPQKEMNVVLFTPDGGRILGAGRDKRIYQWQFVSTDAPGANPVLTSRFAHEAPILSLALSADGKQLLSSAEDRTLKFWSLPELTLQQALPAQADQAAVLAAAPDRKFLVALADGSRQVLSAPGVAAADQVINSSTPKPPLHRSLNALTKISETEPNETATAAMGIEWPTEITGVVSKEGDVDCYRFHATAGETITVAVNAARTKSLLDSKLEILTTDGQPVEQAVLQATRDSWFTFRGKNSDVTDDFRVQNWAEMELNEYLYANGEVVRLWLYPRGPDSGFKVYPGEGKRQPCFGTTALVHALGEPAYIVTPLPAGSQPAPTGLPVFHLNYVNDDEPTRRWGSDSLLLFTAPLEADYVVRLTDVRGFGGKEYAYTLTVRPQQPDFSVTVAAKDLKISPGSGRELMFTATREDGFAGPIRVEVSNLPPGFTVNSPSEIEPNQNSTILVLSAAADAPAPDAAACDAVKLSAVATVLGKEVRHDFGTLGKIALAPPAKVLVEILPPDGLTVFSIRPGEKITARVRATRVDFSGRIELGKEDAGRNLPYGLFVDNIGLSGLLIVEGQTERDFVITASPIAKPGTRYFHLLASADGGQASKPVKLQVLPPSL